jgi:hypothetical protein
MNISYEDTDYSFDLDEIDVVQATLIKRKFDLNLLTLEQGLRQGDPDALRCIYWLMLSQNGTHVNVDSVSFKIVKFANAVHKASM